MTIVILIVAGLIFGALCLGVGYLLGKKNKVIAQAKDLTGKAIDIATEKLGSVKPK